MLSVNLGVAPRMALVTRRGRCFAGDEVLDEGGRGQGQVDGGHCRAPGDRVPAGEQDHRLLLPDPRGVGRRGGAPGGGLLAAPPNFDQPHDRNAWVHYAMGDYPALAGQIDNDAVIPFYSWLAKEFVFADHHFGAGSNSTSGHMLAVGGQTPTLKNPPFVGAHPVWDIPSIFTVAEQGGVSWAAFPDQSGYPTKFYTEPHRRSRFGERAPTQGLHPDGEGRRPCRRSATCGAPPGSTSTRRTSATRPM